MGTESIRERIDLGAREITRLYQRIDETFAHRGEGKAQRDLWSNACSEFHSRYSELAFPGGYDGAHERILAGESLAVEAAICFLERRPYFHRSGYMYKQLLRKVRRAPLTTEQSKRFAIVLIRVQEWRARKEGLACGLTPPSSGQP